MFSKYEIASTFPHTFAEYISDGIWRPYPYLEYISKKIAKAVYEGRGRIVVNMPPQHGKSLFISKNVPIWFLEKWPEKKVILATYGAQFAAQWGRMVRDEFLQNELLKTGIRKDVKARDFWLTEKEGGMFTAGVDGPLTGKSGHLMIIDDPVKNWEEARSPVKREAVVNWFNSTFYTRKQPDTTMILLMTRWHEDDLGGYLLNKHEDDWEHVNFPAIAEEEDFIGRKQGEALCPERYDEKELNLTRKSVGALVWSGLYQQRPTALEGGIIKRDWIKYHYEDIEEAKDSLVYDMMIQSWDLSFKKTETGSFVVGQLWGKRGANFYLLKQIRRRMNYPQTRAAIVAMSNEFPLAMRKVIEDKANGPAIIDDLRDEIPGIVAYKSSDSKESRLSAVSALFEAGNVYIPDPRNNEWVNDFIEEICNFPNASNDDQVDACSQALTILNKVITEYEAFDVKGVSSLYEQEVF